LVGIGDSIVQVVHLVVGQVAEVLAVERLGKLCPKAQLQLVDSVLEEVVG